MSGRITGASSKRLKGLKMILRNTIISLSQAGNFAARKCIFVSALALAGCASLPGPSVPYQSGKNLMSARTAVQSCSRFAPRGGNGAVVGSYAAGVVLGGLVVGPIIVASNQNSIRANGEARAVDRCLANQGYVRRDLTVAEAQALNTSDRHQRELLLNHLIGGGALGTFGS